MIIILKIALLFVLLGMSAFFSGSETAFFSLSRFDIQRMNARGLSGSAIATSLLRKPSRLLVTVLVGNMLVNVSAATFMTSTLMDIVGAGAVPIVVVIMTVLVLIFGEITPKVFAVEHNATWARYGAPLLSIIIVITLPITFVLQKIQGMFLKGTFKDDIRLGEVDLESALEVAHRKGAIGEKARDLLLHFLDLERITAGHIANPIDDVPVVHPKTSSLEALRKINKSYCDYAFISPIEKDHYYIVEQEELAFAAPDEMARELAKKALVVKQEVTLAALFQRCYGKNYRHVVIVDEENEPVGVAEREDILSGIFLEPLIKDEPSLKKLARIGRFYIVDGDMLLEDFNELFGVEISTARKKTIGEFLSREFDRLKIDDTLEYGDLQFRIIRGDEESIERIAVRLPE